MAQHKGKGWFGDSAAHSKAGRKGGLARSQKSGNKSSQTKQSETVFS